MPEETTRPGFRFQKLAAWGPVFILLAAFIFILMGDLLVAGLLVVVAVLYWFLVRRRGTGHHESTSEQ